MSAQKDNSGPDWPSSSTSSDNEKGNDTDISQPESESTPTSPAVEFDNPKGWIAVAAAACSLFVYLGVIYSWGIMQVRLVEVTGTNLTTLTFVGSLATSFMISLSILSGIAVRKLGYQKTALAGGVLMGLGEFLASWTTKHVGALFVFHGVIFGIGGGLSIFACSTAPLRWFKRHRGLAMGIVFGGGSLGAAVMSIATNLLVKQVDVAWTFRILGFMLWGVCIPASYFIQQPEGSMSAGLKLQWHRFREPRFLLIIAGTALSCFPLFIPPYFIPIFTRSMGYSNQIAIIILAAWNLASTVGRVLGGYTADHLLGPLNSLIVCLLFIGLSSLVVWPLASSVGIFSIFLVFNGIGCGAFFSLVPPMLGSTMGPENTLGILPIVWTTWFCGFFFGTPIASGIYSLAGDNNDSLSVFRPAAYYAGAHQLDRLDIAKLTAFLVANSTGTGVLICPGGGYSHVSIVKEGYKPAAYLNELGIDAWVLDYTTTLNATAPIYPKPENEVFAALKKIRHENPKIDKLGIWGFSAGGHLASTTLTNPNAGLDFGILAYPVITLEGNYTHAGSRDNLVGPNATAEELHDLSAQNLVSDTTPPTFLFHTFDDQAVPVQNTLMFAEAMAAHKRKAQVLILPDGPHGLGLALDDPPRLAKRSSTTQRPIVAVK
ncbi:related to protein MCH2 (monocarboxylate permease homolog) [Fusarium fujikuroi IMI 58289]|uniref:Related to protein MCH2 (Monocarboxylate permease homolog) n=1 Tax=Gibberella fujikuroi (strain CBS 195.34 / IMI 58289 / NRRL A-6831) TaxID=1279085 RepID=S0EKZ3_GIBF5|nr:MCH2-like monocarboxylate permease family protein [Fusarium fujikuroi IMI 58289]CCT75311.1 related to protein MCH2 (monocarboxylate permease homolog) [Fusarium fujikuroi IMI 58289]